MSQINLSEKQMNPEWAIAFRQPNEADVRIKTGRN